MKKLLAFTLLLFSAQAVQAQDHQLLNLVLEKKLLGHLNYQQRPTIQPSQYTTEGFESAHNPLPVQTIKQFHAAPALMKQYELVQDPDQYQSLLRVRDLSKNEVRTHISVGRRVERLLADPRRHRLYVLCGGYFGSVWEIDTQRDIVLRKLPLFTPGMHSTPVWNPRQMALTPDGRSLVLASDKIQWVDLASGEVRHELSLPEDYQRVTALQVHSNQHIGLGLAHASGAFKPFQWRADQPEQLQPGGGARADVWHPTRVRLQTAYGNPPPVSRVFFMASRNTDYVRMIDRDSLKTVGVLPLDFNIDDLVLSPDRQRLFVYHQRFGQVSVVELSARTPHQFSVIKRYRDARFLSKTPLQLAAAAGNVFLWDGESQIKASFEAQSLYPRIEVPIQAQLQPRQAAVGVSFPAHQRFALKDGALFAEYLDQAPSMLPRHLDLGSDILDMALSPDRLRLYLLTADTEVLVLDASTHQVLKRRQMGQNPRHLSLSSDGRRLLLIDADKGSLRELETQHLRFTREEVLDVGLQQPYQITLYAPADDQVVDVELPRYLKDIVRLAK